MKLLMISNSTNYGEEYLGWPRKDIKDFLEKNGIRKVLFIPYAGVAISTESLEKSYDAYEAKVKSVYNEIGCEIDSIHHEKDPVATVNSAEAIAVGGGNTFHLVAMMHKLKIVEAIREKVLKGTPYMGWSAGSNVCCPTLMTTNDMPIIEPESFNCLNLIPFQINPHYLDANPEGHGGETRQQRIEEFLVVNKKTKVAGLREASFLLLEGDRLMLKGRKPLRLFEFGKEPSEYTPNSDLSFLMK